MNPRALGIALGVLGLCLPACLDYGREADACAGVVCDRPSPPTCVDGITLRTYHAPGACSQGVCSYPSADEPCADGTCRDGQCVGCQPACAGLACGPDGCGGSCGACQAGCACTAEGQCDCGCQAPDFPPDCLDVPDFECGFMATCQDGALQVSWHVHLFCNGQEQIQEYSCSHACLHGCVEDYLGWPASGTALVEEACLPAAGCQGILLDNQGIPEGYPSLYVEPADAEQTFQDRLAAFKARWGLGAFDYDISTTGITWTPRLWRRSSGPYIRLGEGVFDESDALARSEELLTADGEFFRTAGLAFTPGELSCNDPYCRVILAQDYCGLSVASADPSFDGTVELLVAQEYAGLHEARTGVVPLVPVPRNPLLTGQEARERLLGLELEYWCADGLHTATVSDLSELTLEPEVPLVWAQPSGTRPDALELRLAYRVEVLVDWGLGWTCALDAVDGTLISETAGFICD
ncbi:MAG TPA: hypothetical protein PK668_04845 [Myxococcota bacterium]|nr:hypothetical protein [Myxococcota bacterium]HRY92189.1 hypothetical protein [Myxococcota bacterium]HSA21876.1 hypothetical protein [Myxococcota bacterium]